MILSESNTGVYMIRNTANGQYYIGSAQNLKRRFKEHVRQLKAGTHFNSRLQHAWNKYGANAFVFFPLSLLQSKEQLIPAEQLFIDSYQAANREFGYNARPTAHSNLGHKFSDEVRQKVRAANLGKKASPETRAKMSASAKGTPKGSEHARRISISKTGIKRPPEMVAKLAEKFSQFNADQVKQMRADRQSGMTYRELSALHGCLVSTAHRVINGTGSAYLIK